MARPKETNRAVIRDKRTSLALTAADYDGITTLAQIRGQSVNDFICGVITELVNRNAETIADFNAARDRASAAVNLNVADITT